MGEIRKLKKATFHNFRIENPQRSLAASSIFLTSVVCVVCQFCPDSILIALSQLKPEDF